MRTEVHPGLLERSHGRTEDGDDDVEAAKDIKGGEGNAIAPDGDGDNVALVLGGG